MSSWRLFSRATPVVVSLLVLLGSALAADQAKTPSPEDVVRTYLAAIQKADFKTAYPLLTAEMRGNLDEEKWVAQQIVVMKLGEVTIDSFRTFPPKMQGDKAIVPNLLKSKDKYINQTGANEYELYTLVQQEPDKQWRIDQQALVETDAVHKWFPADVPVE
jgi:hypothetical protein